MYNKNMIRRLTRIGNSYGLVLSRDMLDHLGVDDQVDVKFLEGILSLTKPENNDPSSHLQGSEDDASEKAAAKLYVYINWVASGRTARVHTGECGHCNYGKGCRPGSSNRNGRWLTASFATLAEAESAAEKELPGVSVSLCRQCNPKVTSQLDS
jgi:hypothetical protein